MLENNRVRCFGGVSVVACFSLTQLIFILLSTGYLESQNWVLSFQKATRLLCMAEV